MDKDFIADQVHHSSERLFVGQRIANDQLGIGSQLVGQRDRSAVSSNRQSSGLFDELISGEFGPEHFNL